MDMTRAERLDRCLAALGPAMAQIVQSRQWGAQGAPYVIATLPNGRRRVSIWDWASGDLWVGAGATLDEAMTALETKLGLGTPPATALVASETGGAA